MNETTGEVLKRRHTLSKSCGAVPCYAENFLWTRALIAGIETMHMVKNGQLEPIKDQSSSAANQFYSPVF